MKKRSKNIIIKLLECTECNTQISIPRIAYILKQYVVRKLNLRAGAGRRPARAKGEDYEVNNNQVTART